jgi:hypothetical protein
MSKRSVFIAGITLSLACLLGPGSAQATVKCQCNNGSVTHAMDADYDDDAHDQAESCNDACSTLGGGRAWSVDSDQEDGGDTIRVRGPRPPAKPEPRRR